MLLTARALAAEEGDRDAARGFAVDAAKLAPDLVPAAALAGRLLAEAGDARKAGKLLEAAWRANPHPDLAEAYAHLRLSNSARDRLARVERLAREPAGDREGALAIARAALDAREFATARAALALLTDAPTQRVALLMAELEELEHGDEGRAREWMARALRPRAIRRGPPTALSPIDGCRCRRSPAGSTHSSGRCRSPSSAVRIEDAAAAVLIAPPRDIYRAKSAPRRSQRRRRGVRAPAVAPPRVPAVASARPARPVLPIVPLAQIPDDPGPEPEAILDVGIANEAPPAGWKRIRQLFR